MSEPQAPVETAGNALRAFQGQSLEVNAPFEQVGRLAEAIKNGGGGGGGYDDSELRRRIEALEKTQTFIAQYQQTTAQDIVAFLNNNPHAALLVQNGDDIYTSIYSKIVAENKVVLRTIASLQSKFNIFEYTVTNGSWVATLTPLSDDKEIKALIAKNQGDIDGISKAINRLHNDYLDYEPISGGVCFADNSALPIETDYTMNGEYEFIVKGHTTAQGMGCLIGAYQANNARTTMQLLGKSKKLQGQWAANRELIAEQAVAVGLPDDYLYNTNTYKINKNGVFIKQGKDWLQLVENSGYSGTGDHPFIYLLADRLDHTAHYGVLYYAEILDGNGNTLAVYEPAKNAKTNEIVILQSGNISSVLRPISGSLKEFVEDNKE